MEITPALSDFQYNLYLEKISKAVKDLSTTEIGTGLFMQQMVSLSALLARFNRKLDRSFPAIDKNAKDPTYFIAAYFDTRSVDEALVVYRIVRSLTRIILLSDKFYETGDGKYTLLAKEVRSSLNEFLRSRSNGQNLTYSIDYWLEQFSPFWDFERITRNRMLNNSMFSFNEIRHFILSKSSDALLVYSKVLDAMLPSFNGNVGLILHYNQALLDIMDDWEDIENDIRDEMPNIFVMASINHIPYCKLKESSGEKIREVVLSKTNPAEGDIGRLIYELDNSCRNLPIPNTFSFLKSLSVRYAQTLRRLIFTTNF